MAIPVFVISVATNVFVTLDSLYRPTYIFGAVAFVWFSGVMLTTWQYVGVWRSANRNIVKRVVIGKRPIWAGIAKLTIVLGTFSFLVVFAKSAIPQIKETYRTAFEGDPSVPDYGLRIMRDGVEVEITGGFKYGLTDELLTLLKASPRIETIHLNSIGGRLGEGLRLNKVIREAGLKTYVSSLCASACTIAFAGGVERWIAPEAKMGFHGPAFPGFSGVDLRAANKTQADVMVRSGYDSTFVQKAIATPNDELWMPELEELQAAGVVTHVSDGSQFAVSGLGARATKAGFAALVVNGRPLVAHLEATDPEEFDKLIEAVYDGYVKGETNQDAIETIGYYEYITIVRNIRSASDQVVVDLGRLLVDQLILLHEKNATNCARLAAKGGAVYRIQFSFPSDVLMKYRELGQRVVESASDRPADDGAAVAQMLARATDSMRPALTPAQIALLNERDPKRSDISRYCVAAIRLYQSILKAPQAEAAAILRARMSVD
ncbi:hypothetical protein EV667_3580 [Ancylobacter aquaticus]|uniref:Uncharacterized protein n=2 Tax=Ancylobacter aquaticus TaxID=100 RepID=A0A4R1HUV4_ANCAQ|nr:hypothetical protein EV667_3580 [Ancylobacter aquaticus]